MRSTISSGSSVAASVPSRHAEAVHRCGRCLVYVRPRSIFTEARRSHRASFANRQPAIPTPHLAAGRRETSCKGNRLLACTFPREHPTPPHTLPCCNSFANKFHRVQHRSQCSILLIGVFAGWHSIQFEDAVSRYISRGVMRGP